MTNRARYETKSAALSTEFGYAKAVEWFGEAAVASLPVYVRGQNAGKPKGFYCWTKVVRGGWVSEGGETASGSYSGYVENRVGSIIERQLCELDSGRDGVRCGKVIHTLAQGQTVASKEAERLARIQEGNKLVKLAFRQAMADARRMRDLRTENPDKADILTSLIKDYKKEARKILADLR